MGASSLGFSQIRRAGLAGLAGGNHFLANVGEEAHQDFPRFALQVLDQYEMTDQPIDNRTDLLGLDSPDLPAQLRSGTGPRNSLTSFRIEIARGSASA